ncbi:MAG: hypothetical protein WCL21_02175 [Mariniphaga sp.]
MIIAELSGKLTSKVEEKEDILTSNVFSFFKYSDRHLLKEYLSTINIELSTSEAMNAEFNFWISYDDGTEPDLVITTGDFYILFEAKFRSDFSPSSENIDSQIRREIYMGSKEAENANKTFIYVAITAEYSKPRNKYTEYESGAFQFVWTNWQAISYFIDKKLTNCEIIKDKEFASDLYSLLLRKKLRSFNGLSWINESVDFDFSTPIYYDTKSSKFIWEFSGFIKNLINYQAVNHYERFFHKTFFRSINTIENLKTNNIFYYDNKS